LREAITACAAAQAKAERHQEAVRRARSIVAAAEQRVSEAAEILETARGQHAQMIAEAAQSGTAPKTNATLRAARLEQADREDELLAARAALEQIEADRGDVGDEEAAAVSNVHVAIAGVVMPVAETLLARAKRLRVELECASEILRELLKEEFANDERARQMPAFTNIYKDMDARDVRNAPLQPVRAELEALNSLAAQDDLRRAARAALAPWLQWREALQRDPDAPTPDGGP
jgi:hypothetical protein